MEQEMKILVTGAKGFIGKNLIAELRNQGYLEIYEYDLGSIILELNKFCKDAEFVFHLAGVNRPKKNDEFMSGNFGFTSVLLDTLKKHNNKCPIMMSSSTQAALDNPYGKSKKAGEELLLDYAKTNSTKVYIYRFPNVFGKWCKPNYNSVVATFCHNIAHGIPIVINDPKVNLKLVYIDDVIYELIKLMKIRSASDDHFHEVEIAHSISLGEIANLIRSFKSSRANKLIPDMSDVLTKKLYSTYLSYLPIDEFNYPLKMNVDDRGSFTEFIRTSSNGQVSINISKPGITKGNHWHHTKNEKFLVVSGKGVIRLRKVNSTEVVEYFVSSDRFEVIDIPVGYTHNIENLGDKDMVTIMWVNECFDPKKPDTFYLEV